MKLAILLHLYQPVTQGEKTFREIAESSYLPLIKLLKNRKNFKLTLNLPLSLLEQMDRYRYSKWMSAVKELVDSEYVELTGSGAYHPLLTKLPDEVIYNQVILNEYGLGYHLGRRTGFEGEQAIMIRDLQGFFSPELAVNNDLHKVLEKLDYKWVLVDPSAVKDKPGVFKLNDSECALVSRDTNLSNFLAFSRGLAIRDDLNYLDISKDTVVAVDGETFGHHNQDGIHFLGKVIDKLLSKGTDFVTVSELVDSSFEETEFEKIESFEETTWASIEGKDSYHLWEGNPMQDILWNMYNEILSEFSLSSNKKYEDMENVALWKKEDLPEEVQNELEFNQLLSSDPFWWLSGEQIGDTVLYNKDMVWAFVDKYIAFAESINNDNLKKFLEETAQKLFEEMTKHEDSNTITPISTT